MERPLGIYPLAFLHLFLGVCAVCGGGMMIMEPGGSFLHMQGSWLKDSGFNSFLFPGIILFVMNGLFPLFVFTGMVFKIQWKHAGMLNIYTGMNWVWTYSIFTGIIAVAWIAFQQLLTGYFWIQPIITFIGLLIIVFTMLPSTIRYFKAKQM